MYIKTFNGQVETYPYSIGLLRKDNPQTSFPANPSSELLAEFGVFPVQTVPQPEVDYTMNVKEGAPVNQGGWKQTWVVSDATTAEVEARVIEKNQNLKQQRAEAYQTEADPLFFKAQRGEATMNEWQSKVEEIKARFPYVE